MFQSEKGAPDGLSQSLFFSSQKGLADIAALRSQCAADRSPAKRKKHPVMGKRSVCGWPFSKSAQKFR